MLSLCASVALLAAFDARADEVAELRARVEALERALAQLQRTQASAAGATPAPNENATKPASTQTFVLEGSDDARMIFRGLLHFDARRYGDDGAADGWLLRRARPIVQARLTDSLEVVLTPEFGGNRASILDAFLALRATPSLRLTAGKFKVPVGLERIMAAADLRFTERALPTSLAPNRDLGVQLQGDLAQERLSYSLGYFNGVSDGGSSENNSPPSGAGDWAARLFAEPFLHDEDSPLRGLGVGVAATYARDLDSEGSLPVYKTSGQQDFFFYRTGVFADGERSRLTAQFYYHHGPFGALGEIIESEQRLQGPALGGVTAQNLENSAWQLQLAWLLTGEEQRFRGPIEPLTPFSLDGGAWGALEIVTRYHALDIDNDAFSGGLASLSDPNMAASEARAFGVGVNWYLNAHLKCSLSYERTRFEGGAFGGADRADERFLSGRFAVAF